MATTATSGHLSTTVLFGKGLTPGKLRGLQRISNPNGTLTMVALDQNSSMIEMATKALKGKGQDREPTYEEIVEAKVDLARQLAPAASGVLIDAYYGAWSCVATGAIGPQTGLLVRVEMSGSPKNKVGAPMGLIEPGWSVEKIKLMGADAVKLLAQFEPTEPISAEHQFQLIDACLRRMQEARHPAAARDGGVPVRRREEDRRQLHEAEGRDGHRVGPPAQPVLRRLQGGVSRHLGQDSDDQLHDNLQALDAASERPWVLLSAGVDYPDYFKQVEMAMECGASGVLGGRAFWKEYFLQDGDAARSQFAATTALKRVADVDTVVREHGSPWFARYGLTVEDLTTVRATEGWHARYGSGLGAARPTARPERPHRAKCIDQAKVFSVQCSVFSAVPPSIGSRLGRALIESRILPPEPGPPCDSERRSASISQSPHGENPNLCLSHGPLNTEH